MHWNETLRFAREGVTFYFYQIHMSVSMHNIMYMRIWFVLNDNWTMELKNACIIIFMKFFSPIATFLTGLCTIGFPFRQSLLTQGYRRLYPK